MSQKQTHKACTSCGKSISVHTSVCPECGAKQSNVNYGFGVKVFYFIGWFFIVIVMLGFGIDRWPAVWIATGALTVFYFIENKNRIKDEEQAETESMRRVTDDGSELEERLKNDLKFSRELEQLLMAEEQVKPEPENVFKPKTTKPKEQHEPKFEKPLGHEPQPESELPEPLGHEASGRPKTHSHLSSRIIKVAHSYKGRVTPTEVAFKLDIPFKLAKEELENLADQGACRVSVGEAGMIVYYFPEFEDENSKKDVLK